MSKALVTGGAGFIGSNVVKLLAGEGYDVVVLDNLFSGYRKNLDPFPQVELVEADVRDGEAVARAAEGAEVVFHLAASVGNVRSIENPVDDSEVNVLGTIRVLEAARRAGVRKIVCSSSAAIFGELRRLPIDEEHPAEPDSPYGVSKLAAEKLCLAYSRLYDGLEAVCLRYFNVYGVNQRYDAYGNVIPIFAHRMLRGAPLTIYGDGEQTRDFVNVVDVARANLLAAQARGVSGAFNVASGVTTTVNRLAEMMREASGLDAPVGYAPPRKGEVRDSRADISAARAALGFEPTVGMAEGLAEYMAWARTELA
ncbi:MAG TPA: SDR family oxidoreductase [Pyrinomonadaceae bacterium]|jgi:UDP-glucose 4-epimerase